MCAYMIQCWLFTCCLTLLICWNCARTGNFSMQQMAVSAFTANPSSSHGNTLSGLCSRRPEIWHRRRIGSRIRAQAQSQMQYRKLGDSDLVISEVTLGTVCAYITGDHVSCSCCFLHLILHPMLILLFVQMTFGEQNTEKEAHDILSYSFDQGVNILDTAEMVNQYIPSVFFSPDLRSGNCFSFSFCNSLSPFRLQYPVPPRKETQGRTDLYIGSWMQSKPRDKVTKISSCIYYHILN